MKYGGPILEMGCGTGEKVILLAKQGFTVVGIDNSESMISFFRQKLQNLPLTVKNNIELIKDNMINPLKIVGIKKFSLILLPCSLFLHLSNDKDRLSCLKSCYELLDEDGVILIINTKLEEKEEYDWKEFRSKSNPDYLLKMQGRFVDKAYQEDMKLILSKKEEHYFKWRLFTIKDEKMKNLLSLAKLLPIKYPKNFPDRPLSNIYLCQKDTA